MHRGTKFICAFSLLVLLVLIFTKPASAFDGRWGENIVIPSDEVIDDDLYVTAGTFVLDGTVNGDLIGMGQTLTINGKVDGDMMAAGEKKAWKRKTTKVQNKPQETRRVPAVPWR